MASPIYLDHNASTPVPARVRAAVARALEDGSGNPSADHAFGRRSRAIVEQARAKVATLLGCEPDEIFFTAGGTESNNLAVRGIAGAVRGSLTIVTSTIEHPAIERPVDSLASRAAIVRVGVDARGVVDLDAVERALAGSEATTKLVTILLAQNETGVIQPIAEIAARAKAHGAIVHTDAAQAVGKVRVDVRALGVDLVTVAGHKLYAPKGVGALYVRRGVALEPLLVGAGHERGLRPGTENVAGIAGLGEACAMAMEDLDAEAARQAALRDALAARLATGGFVVHGADALRLPNTLSGRFPGVRGSALVKRCPELAFTTGSACHSGEEHASGVLLAMGLEPDEALGAIRLSLGRSTTEADVERAAAALLSAARAGA